MTLGAAGNVVLGWIAARGADLDVGRLLAQPVFYLAVLLALMPWLTHTARLWIWSDFLRRPMALVDLFRIVLGAEVCAAITPTAAGGGYAKVALLVERGFPAGMAASVMILGSVEDYTFFAVAIPLGLLALPSGQLHALRPIGDWLGDHLLLPGVVAGVGATGVIIFRRLITRRLGRLWSDFIDVFRLILERGKVRFLVTLGLVALHWTCRYLATALLLTCLGVTLNPVLVFLLQWVVFTAALAVPTPGGMVGAEAAFFVVYRAFIPGTMLPAAVAGWRLLTFYGPLALAALGFTLLQRHWRPLARPAPSPTA